MCQPLYPLTFDPLYRDHLWGGQRIARRFGRKDAPPRCAESWELAAHPDGTSVVREGALAGRRLDELCRIYGPALLGSHCESGRFPLLVKLIDANERLSMQVHPNESTAVRSGGEPKTEMWYLLDCDPGAALYAGFDTHVTPRRLGDALLEKRADLLMRRIPAEPGKALYVPGGMVHAIGEGCLLLEIQQSSNTTFRLYDWDRDGADGRTRELHLNQAFDAIDWQAPRMDLRSPVRIAAGAADNEAFRVLRSDFFSLHRTLLNVDEPLPPDETTFRALFVEQGAVGLTWAAAAGAGEGRCELAAGELVLLPASLGEAALCRLGPADAAVLTITL